MPELYKTEAHYAVRFDRHTPMPLELVAATEKAAQAQAKTWRFYKFNAIDRFVVVFLVPDLFNCKLIYDRIGQSFECLNLGLNEVKKTGYSEKFDGEPYKFRLGSKVRAKCDVTCAFDEETLAPMHCRGTVYEHVGHYEYKVLFDNGDPDGKLVLTQQNELMDDIMNVVTIE